MGFRNKLLNFRQFLADNGYIIMIAASSLVVGGVGGFIIAESGIRVAALYNLKAISGDVETANDYYSFKNNAFQVTTKNEQAYVNFIGPAQKTAEDEKTITAFTVPISNQLADNINKLITNYYSFDSNNLEATYQIHSNTLASNWNNLAKDIRTVASQPAETITPLITLSDIEVLIGQQNNNEQLAAFIPVQENEAVVNTYQTRDNHMKINSYQVLDYNNLPTLEYLGSQELATSSIPDETLSK